MVAEYPSVRWIQTVAASVATDTRAVNAAVILLASTFGYQTIEYQEKAVQFFSQTMLSITAAPQKGQQSMSSVFAGASQEEEKRRKERKNNAVVSIVLAALSAIVAALPCEPGETLVTVWGQMVVDRLCELLAHSNAGALVGQRLAHGLYGGSSACDAPRNHPPPPSPQLPCPRQTFAAPPPARWPPSASSAAAGATAAAAAWRAAATWSRCVHIS